MYMHVYFIPISHHGTEQKKKKNHKKIIPFYFLEIVYTCMEWWNEYDCNFLVMKRKAQVWFAI